MINKVAKMSRFSKIALIICLVNFLIGLFMLGWLFKNRSYSSRTAIDAHASNKIIHGTINSFILTVRYMDIFL